jgi:hypothetical protein
MPLKSFSSRSSYLVKKLKTPGYVQQRSVEAYRTITSPLRLLPSFIIIGVQKGGTTSLYRYLEQHPCVAPAFAKEVHFFDNHNRAYNFGKGMAWYRSHFVYHTQQLYKQLVYKQPLITGEASPDYIFDLHAPERIASALPNVKLIVLLRNPVDRAYSHYLHNVRATWDKDREPLSFEDAIKAEPERLVGEREKRLDDSSYFSYNYMHYTYLARGLYADQLNQWFQLFSQEQFLILKSEDFFVNPKPMFEQVLNFLGLPSWSLSTYQSFNSREQNSITLKTDTREQLIEYFKPHNQRLYALLGNHLGWDT